MNKIVKTYILINKIASIEERCYPFDIDKVMVDEYGEIYVEGIQSFTGGLVREVRKLNKCTIETIKEIRLKL